MNQKEEIGKLKDELGEKEKELKQLRMTFNEKYGNTVQAINKANAKMADLRRKKQDILMRKVKLFSDNPTRYLSNNDSSQINSDIVSKIRQIEEDTGQEIRSESARYIWDEIYHKIIRESPEIKKLDKEIDDIDNNLWDGVPKRYIKLEEGIHDVDRSVSWLKQRIDKLSDIGYFRQWAKQSKEREADATTRKEAEKAVEIFKEYFNKEYLPKITEE